jgi:hypothetical protein
MKSTKNFVSVMANVACALFCCAVAMSVFAQDVPIRVTRDSSAPIPYVSSFFNVDGLRVSLNELSAVPPSISVIGSRVVATLLIVTDSTPPFRLNSKTIAAALAPGTYTLEVVERGATVPERRSAPVSFTVPSPTEASVPAFTVFDRKIKKFFLTAKASDVAALVASNNATTGPEWIPVEDNIRVWTTPQPFTVPVCRFYVPAAAVHFFSADEFRDCRKLRGLAGFVDEGTAFHVIPPYREPDVADSGGPYGKLLNVCPIGTDPVHRMFDDTPGHAAHRYSTNPDTVRNFLPNTGTPSGYRLEGVAFCSPRE